MPVTRKRRNHPRDVRNVSLNEAVGEHFGRLGDVPLCMATEPRVVVEDREEIGRHEAARAQQYLARTLVEVEVPERVDVLDLVAADLALLEALGRRDRATRRLLRTAPTLLEEPL